MSSHYHRSFISPCGRRKGKREGGGNGARVRMAIRWNKRPEASGGEPHYLFGRFIRWSRAAEFRSSTGWLGQNDRIIYHLVETRRDNADLVSRQSQLRDKGICRACLSCILSAFLSRSRSLDCFTTEAFDKSLVWLLHLRNDRESRGCKYRWRFTRTWYASLDALMHLIMLSLSYCLKNRINICRCTLCLRNIYMYISSE